MTLDVIFTLDELEAAEAASANPYLSNPARGLQLLTRLVGQPAAQEAQRAQLARLHTLIHQDFIALTARGSYPGEAQALRQLLGLEEALENLALFPDLASKTVVGVGGGFSAGKSRFLNTLLGVDLLPESLEPTTAIPSFITRGEADIVALNTFNQRIPLDHDALQAITHAFNEHYRDSLGEGFGFAHILKLLMLHQAQLPWDNLAFLDTPGYSKADTEGAALTDQDIAHRQLSEADQVLWLLSAKNGSIRQDDLEFLRTLDHSRPIFFVVTQADLVGEARIGAILDSTRQAIEQADIPCAGLMAWAAPLGTEQGELIAGDDIRDWLEQLDGELKYTRHRRTCERVLDGYIHHNQYSLAGSRKKLALLNTLLPLADQLPEGERNTLRELIQEQQNNQKSFTDLVSAFSALKSDMLAAVVQVVGDLAIDAPSSEETLLKALKYHDNGKHELALACFQDAAELGHPAAQFNLGLYHTQGLGTPKSDQQAIAWYRKAAEQGHAGAQFNLGTHYGSGCGVKKDSSQAVFWYTKAAEQGHADAQFNLGESYANGEGVPRNEQKAIAWYQIADAQDHLAAQFQLLQLSARQGNKDSQFALAICYEKGRGTVKDIKKSVEWYRIAAKAGHPDAQFKIAEHYLSGEILPKNSAHAKSWLEKSATQGNSAAIALLKKFEKATWARRYDPFNWGK
ncbi:dynamin family protein [Aquitalea sp. ASV15]|uniref:dynamin family protein n=1 Tax=Aquitalea sp. ASV15 TaxID=2795104 RepID=UPI0018ED68B9|nr:dynamin family protein [Aquitalea sp. ASV15]